METFSNGSFARVLADIAVVFSSGDQPEARLERAIELLRQVVPYHQCALLTLQPDEAFLTCPREAVDDGVRETLRQLLADLRLGEQQGGGTPDWPRWDAHLVVPLVNPDVHVVGLLLLTRHASESFNDVDLRVLASVAGQLASYVSWLQYRDERTAMMRREQLLRLEADRANQAKDAFLATLSHELRSPLNAIVGWSDMLLRGSLPPTTVERALQAIHRNARAQTHLIDDVLDVSRIISGKLLIEKRPIDLNAVLQAAVEGIRPAADDKKIDLVAYLPDAPTPLLADPDRLQQVFLNLLNNAVKFTPSGRSVRLSVAKAGDQVHVVVQDTGIGIEANALPRVFDRFFQHDSSTTRRYTGLGLGLAIVRHIVEQHGGSVHVTSEGENKGSSFTVTLQAEAAVEATASAAPATGSSERTLHGLRLDNLSILVVDDEAQTRELLAALLALHGATVTLAEDADHALALLTRSVPDILVGDIAMPGKDGIEFMREVRARGFVVPALALSAHGRGEDRVQALKAGFDLHLAKPVLPADLIFAVTTLARRSAAAS